MATKTAPTSHLKIHARRTLASHRPTAIRKTAYCTWRERSIEIEECMACDDCEGIVLDPAEHDSFVICSKAKSEAEGMQPGEDSRSPRDKYLPLVGRTRVFEVMTANVCCVRAEFGVQALRALFLEKRIGAAPVVDESGRPIGMVTKTDLLRNRRPRARARDIMTRLVSSMHENTSLSQGAARMVAEDLHHMPIVGDDGKVVGILSSLDIARWVAAQDGYVVQRLSGERTTSTEQGA